MEEAFRNIEAPEVLEAVQQPVGVGGIAARLELLAAIIIYWNTLKLGDAVFARRQAGLVEIPGELLAHVSPLGWEHHQPHRGIPLAGEPTVGHRETLSVGSRCAVTRRHSTAGANPARQLSLQPVAVGADDGGNDIG